MNKNLVQEKPLPAIIGNMLAAAQKEPGRLQTKRLGKGLRITMVVKAVNTLVSTTESIKINQLTLTLNRNETYPSATEWFTVLDAFP